MDGFLGKIKEAGRDALGTFVVLEDGSTVAADSPAAQAGASRPAATTPAPQASAGPPAVVGTVTPDPEFIQQLQSAVEGSAKSAYAQFQALYEAMSMLTDERARVQAALTATQTAHKLTAADVAAAIDDRLQILAGERTGFEKAAKAEMESAVGETLNQVEKARTEIARKQEEIRQLEAKAAELERQAADARAAIDQGSARFAVSYAVVEAQLTTERARIAQFVNPNPKP
jgi:hypothetical protein